MRFKTFLLGLALIFATSSALAVEKKPDLMNVVAKATLTPPVAGSLTTSSGTYDRIYTSGGVDAQCGAEAFDSANDGMYFDIYCLQVDDNNPIDLILDANGTNIADTVLTLYCSPFNPTQPQLNVVAFDDDSGESTLSAITAAQIVRLVEGQEYWLVISSYGANMTGDYVIQKSSNVYDCGVVTNERATWGAIKGMYR
jgi:hypothetical protein